MTEERADLTPTGCVLLDVGDDVGALIVYVDASLLGREVEVRPLDREGRPTHADVLERRTASGAVHAVVIPGLPAGRYSIWLDAELPWGEADIRGGQVAEVDRQALASGVEDPLVVPSAHRGA